MAKTFKVSRRALVVSTAVGVMTTAAEAQQTPSRKYPKPDVEKGYVDGPFGQIHYRKTGRGVPLVMCHQSPNSSAMFEAAYPRFAAKGIMVIALDTPGYGMSDRPPGQPSIPDFARAIGAIMDHFGLKQTTLLGHHTGGNVTAAFAHQEPARITKLILGSPRIPTAQEFAQTRNQVQAVPKVTRDGSHLLEMWKRRLTYPMAREDLDLANRHFCHSLLHWDGFFHGTNASVAYDIRPALQAFKMPVLIISGVHDGQHKYVEEAKAIRPDFTYVDVPDASSYIIDENPDGWVEAVARFVKA